MKCKSFHTLEIDLYEAGVKIGEELKDISPEVIILFSSVHYLKSSELIDGIYDAVENRDVIIFGGTGDGFYSADISGNHGASAIGINSEGKIKWVLEIESDVGRDSFSASAKCAEKIVKRIGRSPDTALVLSDGIVSDGVRIIDGINSVFKIPFCGGTTGDDLKFEKSFIVANREITQNSVAILGMLGDFSFAMNASSGWKPIGLPARIDVVERNIIKKIDGISPIEFVEKQLGSIPPQERLALFPLAVYDENDNFFLRAIFGAKKETGEIIVAGSIAQNSLVKMTHATIDDILNGVDNVVKSLENIDFKPSGAIVFSCAGRKLALGSKIDEERKRLFSIIGKRIPLGGSPTFGEIGPFRNPDGSYTPTYFHNETYVLFLFGEKNQ